ncbi:MAG: hypothetical protein ACOYOF_19260, partial [Verrucomicrobiaceae bacterium]
TAALVMLLLTSLAPAQDKAPQTPTNQVGGKAASVTQPTPLAQGLGAFGKILPRGEKNIDVKIPSFKDGFPSSLVRAGSLTRIDNDTMIMEKMDIRLYGDPSDAESHKKDVRVRLVTAQYHMPSQILTSDQRSRVSRSDFDLQGDSMIFDTKTQQGKMTGNIHMVIYDAASMLKPVNDEEKASAPTKQSPNAQPKPSATNETP